MAKRLKGILILLLTALLLTCALVLFFPKNLKPAKAANATGHENHALNDDNFAWNSGAQATMSKEGDEIETALRFTLKLKNSAFENLMTYAPPINGYLYGEKYYENYFIHEINVHRVNANGSAVSTMSIMLAYDICKVDGEYVFERTWATKDLGAETTFDNLVTDPAQVHYHMSIGNGEAMDKGNPHEDILSFIEENGYTLQASEFVTDSEFFGSTTGLDFDVNESTLDNVMYIDVLAYSPHTTYFVEFNYYYRYAFENSGVTYDIAVEEGTIDSDSRSVAYILNAMENDGILEDYCNDNELYTAALDIITSGAKKDVRISYLEKIDNSNFAKKVTKTVSVPIYQGELKISDLLTALNVETLDCLDSRLGRLEANEENTIYNAHYYPDIWLRSITTDGNYLDYFLDINLSYEQMYKPFVESGIITQDLYEYLFSKMLDQNEGAATLQPSEVYGYWGLVALPTTYTFNTLWKEMFDIKTSRNGLLCEFSYELNISFESYQKLLTDYQYGWLDKVWGAVAGFVAGSEYPATFYLFYSTPDTIGEEPGYIDDTGKDDPENPDPITPDPGDVLKPVIKVGKTIWDKIWGFFEDAKNFAFSWKGIITSVLVIAGVIVIVKLKSKGGKRRK